MMGEPATRSWHRQLTGGEWNGLTYESRYVFSTSADYLRNEKNVLPEFPLTLKTLSHERLFIVLQLCEEFR